MLRKETIERNPEIADALNKLAGKITDDEMREMNYQVIVEGVSPQKVAEKYLSKKKLIKK